MPKQINRLKRQKNQSLTLWETEEVPLLSEALDWTKTSLLGEVSREPICENAELNPTDRTVASDFPNSERLSKNRTPLKATGEDVFGRALVRKLETEGRPFGKSLEQCIMAEEDAIGKSWS